MTGENMRNFMKIVEENSKKQLNELFKGTPYPVKFHAGASGPVARFSSKNGDYEILFSEEESNEYTVSFRQVGAHNSNQYDTTGTGDQYQILNTVTTTVMDFIRQNDPEYVVFTGSKKDGHAKLYSAIVRMLTKELQSLGYTVSSSNNTNDVMWSFIKDMGDDDDDAFESKNPNMRDIMNIYEAGLFPDAPRMIRIDPNVYKLMRALLFIANPEAYENNSNHDDAGMMVFGDEITYKETTEKLKSFGIPFKDDTEADVKTADGELMPDKEGQISPYPNNKAKKIKKKTITPNPFKHNS